MKEIIYFILFIVLFTSCQQKEKTQKTVEVTVKEPHMFMGYNLDDYVVVNHKIEKGETFGTILDKNHVFKSAIYKIAEEVKDTFDVRRLRAGKDYTILAKKDTTEQAQVFIYKHDLINYSIVDFRDSIYAKKIRKPVRVELKSATGVITSSLSQALDEKHVSPVVANELSNIYAWTIDFFRLQKEDKFKVIYEQKFIDDTIPAGIGRIKAAYFEHSKKPFYAFSYEVDSILGIEDYFDEKANNLRRAFLKAPLKFSRISSRYNLKRRIAYYGKIKPHLGTDFAAPIGSPIMSTADGRVIESKRRGGNGNYVKIRHNATYMTQYLHMKKRKVRVGDYVRQGDVIGWVGMTGNTSGPHVCYRFWKNGRQVDPLREKLPVSKPLKKELQPKYYNYITPFKQELDSLAF